MSKAKAAAPPRARPGGRGGDLIRTGVPGRREASPLNPQLYRDLGAIAVAALGAVLLLGLSREKLVGPLGGWLVMAARLLLGTGVFVSPFLCGVVAMLLAGHRPRRRGAMTYIGLAGLVLAFLGWLHVLAWGGGDLLATTNARWAWLKGTRSAVQLAQRADGGVVGALVAGILSPLGIAGSYVALGAIGASALLVLTETTLGTMARRVRDSSRSAASLARSAGARYAVRGARCDGTRRRRRNLFLDFALGNSGLGVPAEEKCQPEADPVVTTRASRRAAAPAEAEREPMRFLPSLRGVLNWKREVIDPFLMPAPAAPETGRRGDGATGRADEESIGPSAISREAQRATLSPDGGGFREAMGVEPQQRDARDSNAPDVPASSPHRPIAPSPRRDVPVTRAQERPYRPSRAIDLAEYTLPSTELLDMPPPCNPRAGASETERNIPILESTLADFNVEAQVVEIADGPTVTRYEIRLAPGIRVKRIIDLADNICLSLAALSVRVEAPIPGKSAIGIEVPKKATRLVTLRECVETRAFMEHPSRLSFMLGVDVAGDVRFADLVRMPHLLVAGATNSGKSVLLNVLIASMLFRARPDEVKFIFIDPKRVELTLFEGIPHLIHPVVKDVKQAAGLLRWVLKEMERRYDLFAEALTRNIDGYNGKVGDDPDKRLPYIVVVIDELADLMMLQGAEVETAICRLAQLARATGIHLVIATQRPSVDVITGLIKANVPSRIAFSVTSQIDSRTILDSKGAENLVGRGDMLFKPVDANKATRVQGAFLTEDEVVRLVEYLKTQGRPEYLAEPVSADSLAATRSGGGGGEVEEIEEEDELFEPAAKFLVSTGHASTSMLQRKFKVGYTRAARLVDMMEAKGIVGPLDGAKPREILMGPARLDAYFQGQREAFLGPLGLGSEEQVEDAPFDDEPYDEDAMLDR